MSIGRPQPKGVRLEPLGRAPSRSRRWRLNRPRIGDAISSKQDDLISNRDSPIGPRGTCPSLRSYRSGPGKDLAMFRLLSILAFSALCILPDRASADALKPHESVASEISSRQRCACSTWRMVTGRGPVTARRTPSVPNIKEKQRGLRPARWPELGIANPCRHSRHE